MSAPPRAASGAVVCSRRRAAPLRRSRPAVESTGVSAAMSPSSRHPPASRATSSAARRPPTPRPSPRSSRTVEIERHGTSEVTVEYVREEWALPRLSPARRLVGRRGRGRARRRLRALLDGGAARRGSPPSSSSTPPPRTRAGRAPARPVRDAGGRAGPCGWPSGGATLGVWAHESDARRLELLERRGYRRERAFLRLERDLDDSLEPPVWPAGILVRAVPPGRRRRRGPRRPRGGVRRPLRPRRDGPRGVDPVSPRQRGPRSRTVARRVGRRRGGGRHRGRGDPSREATWGSSSCAGRGAAAASAGR